MLSQRLKHMRKLRKYTQEELAKKVNTTKGTISNYENGYSTPSNEMLALLADVLETSTDYLLGRSDNPRSNNPSNHKDNLPRLTEKDERDIAKQLEKILDSMDSDTALAFDGEPLDEETKELVRAAIESNLRLTKQLAKKKFTPKKYRKD